jgi:Zn-dependent peptidase ImmA (M78 family)/transcriptional regulator with XRE-family HTH domain
MRSQLPSFIGDNLKEAREVRGLSQTTLAESVGVTRQAISQYEKKQKTPSHDVLVRISDNLKIPILFFFQRRQYASNNKVVFFRSMSAVTNTSRLQAKRKLFWIISCVQYLKNYIEFPVVNYPDFDIPVDPSNLTFQEIEKLANETRRYWGLGNGPISNILWLLENNGGVVGKQVLDEKKLDAFSHWHSEDSTPYYVLVADKASAVRSRFDATHELGHIILHRKISFEDFNTQAIFKLIEGQANYFAASFLLPEETFSNDAIVPSLNLLISLKSKWKVSISAMIKRMRNLKLISKEREQRLYANLSRRGWRITEPLDEQFEPEKSRLFQRAFELLLENNIINSDDIVNNLGIHLDDLEKVLGLPDFFNHTRSLIKFPAIIKNTQNNRKES